MNMFLVYILMALGVIVIVHGARAIFAYARSSQRAPISEVVYSRITIKGLIILVCFVVLYMNIALRIHAPLVIAGLFSLCVALAIFFMPDDDSAQNAMRKKPESTHFNTQVFRDNGALFLLVSMVLNITWPSVYTDVLWVAMAVYYFWVVFYDKKAKS